MVLRAEGSLGRTMKWTALEKQLTMVRMTMSKKQGPMGLVGVQTFGRLNVGEILVVSPYNKRNLSSLQPVPPLFEGQLDSQKLMVAYIVIALSRRKTAREESTQMEFLIMTRALGEDGSGWK